MDFKSLLNKLDGMEAKPVTPSAPVLPKSMQLNEDAQLRVLSGRTTYVAEAKKNEEAVAEAMNVGDKKKTKTGELTKTSTGVAHKNTSYADGGDDDVAPKSGKGKTHAKGETAAEKKDKAPAQKFSPKSAGTSGMKDGVKFDNRKKESIGEASEAQKAAREKFMSMVKGKKSKKDTEVKEGTESMPSKAHIAKMCKDGKTTAEICKMHPDCDQSKLKEMIKDCKSMQVKEGAKPDFLDVDKDGDKKEPMKKAVADKKKGAAPKKGVNPFAKKKTVKESIETKLSFKQMVQLVQESGGQQQIDAVDKVLFTWAERVAKAKLGEGMKAEVFAGLIYERNGGTFEMYDVLSEARK
jgi:hypothetical protein